MNDFSSNIIDIIKAIPKGKIASYGQIAKIAGNSRGSRQASRILHSCSSKYNLPWHRVVNSKGEIALSDDGLCVQKTLLQKEGIEFSGKKILDFKSHLIKEEEIEEMMRDEWVI